MRPFWTLLFVFPPLEEKLLEEQKEEGQQTMMMMMMMMQLKLLKDECRNRHLQHQ